MEGRTQDDDKMERKGQSIPNAKGICSISQLDNETPCGDDSLGDLSDNNGTIKKYFKLGTLTTARSCW